VKVTIELKETAQALVYDDVPNAYTKGPFYCVYATGGFVYKFPIVNIWRITESYR
jgi:hypothetical protein